MKSTTRNKEIPSGWKLPEEITKRLGSRSGKQRVIAENDHILIILHKVPKKNESKRKSLFFWRDPSGEWKASESGDPFQVLDKHLESYAKVESDLDALYDKAVKAQDFFILLENITPVERAIKNTDATLQSARELAGEIFINYRDRAHELNRNISLLYTHSKNGLDYAIAKRTEEQSEIQEQALIAGHRLNVIMALFLPITAVASLLGMNIPHGLENSSTNVFWSIVIVSGLLGLVMRSWVLRKPKAKSASKQVSGKLTKPHAKRMGNRSY